MAAIDRTGGIHTAVQLTRLLTPVLLWLVVLVGILALVSFGSSALDGI